MIGYYPPQMIGLLQPTSNEITYMIGLLYP